MHHNAAIIGLGNMGRRMLLYMTRHDMFTVSAAWDPDAAARDAVRRSHPDLSVVEAAPDAIGADATDVVYIACPPAAHKGHVLAAAAAGKAVFCEKPLGVDVAESRDLVARIEEMGTPNAVNFSFAGRANTRIVEDRIREGALGRVHGVDVRHDLAEWPSGGQKGAQWLAKRAEGGFVRENITHFIYLSERLFGRARLTSAHVRFADDGGAETHVLAELECGGVPISIAGGCRGVGPKRWEFTVWGSRRSYRLQDMFGLVSSDGGAWTDELAHVEDPERDGWDRQLDDLAALVAGEPSPIPGFREALTVQVIVEAILDS